MILAVGIAYLVFVLCTDWGIPCVFSALTGLECPGCGVSRMLVSLVRLDLAAAFSYNPFLLLTSPLLFGLLVSSDAKYVRTGERRLGRAENVLLWVELILALLYGVLRNIF